MAATALDEFLARGIGGSEVIGEHTVPERQRSVSTHEFQLEDGDLLAA